MLLRTKLEKPVYDNECVVRERLLNRLAIRPQRKLVVITAPPGFGKTTLVNQFLSEKSPSHSWITLDERDNNAKYFWRYILEALKALSPAADLLSEQLQNDVSDIEGILATLINDLSAQEHDQDQAHYLILDDFHLISSPDISKQLTFLIEYIPSYIQIVIISCIEPNLPIARWKVKNYVDHINGGELAFSEEESALFLNKLLHNEFSEKQCRAFYEKTEGWIAAMKLAILDRTIDYTSATFSYISGRDKYISDYIFSEVIASLDNELRTFIEETACLKKLNAELCDHIRNSSCSQNYLSDLYSRNLFIQALDNTHEWYRYQDVFRESVLASYQKTQCNQVKVLQNRAIDWYLDHNLISDAIDQLIETNETERLEKVLETHGNTLIYEGFHENILQWLEKLPYQSIESNVRLLMLKIWALFFSNKVDVISPFLGRLEDLLDKYVADSHEDAPYALTLHNEISLIRSYIARMNNDLDSAGELTKDVLRNLDNSNMPVKSMTYYGIGLDSYAKGDLPSAREALQSAIEYGKLERKISTVLPSSGLLSWILYHQGEPILAKEVCLQNQSWIDSQYQAPGQPRLISCWQNSALAEIHRDRNEISAAQSYIAPLLKHLKVGTEPGQHIIIQYVRAHLAFTTQDYKSAIEYLDDAIQLYEIKKESVLFDPPCLSALKARCHIAVGNLDSAKQWYDSCSKSSQSATPLSQEQEAITMARVQLALDNPALAQEIIEPLFEDAEKGGHGRHLIEMHTLQAMAKLQQGDKSAAQEAINTAVSLAAKNKIITLFVEEGLNIIECITLVNTPHISDQYRESLLSALNITRKTEPRILVQTKNVIEGLLEPISHRELEVLDLINQGLANKEIASKLGLAPATVKAHIRNIYGKIGAKSRTEALARARELNILNG